jgi:dihydroxyacetone kinase-like predicted kinase
MSTGEEEVFAALRKKKESGVSGQQLDEDSQRNWVAGLAAAVDLTQRQATTIDGLQFSLLWTAGFLNLAKNVNHLNKINVFPVPDGDTGSNMKLGMMEGIKCLANDKIQNIDKAATSLAADTLMYGQGNSGSILSFFFGKLAIAVKQLAAGRSQISVAEFAQALEQVGPQMQGAALKPVEGTLLSTSRDCCIGMALPSPPETMLELLEKWHKKAEEELAKTPDQVSIPPPIHLSHLLS